VQLKTGLRLLRSRIDHHEAGRKNIPSLSAILFAAHRIGKGFSSPDSVHNSRFRHADKKIFPLFLGARRGRNNKRPRTIH
jgi:hypothetical protein